MCSENATNNNQSDICKLLYQLVERPHFHLNLYLFIRIQLLRENIHQSMPGRRKISILLTLIRKRMLRTSKNTPYSPKPIHVTFTEPSL